MSNAGFGLVAFMKIYVVIRSQHMVVGDKYHHSELFNVRNQSVGKRRKVDKVESTENDKLL